MLKSFPPEINEHTQKMVIGTMPGVVSLEKQQYYAHNSNLFWKFVSEIFNEGKPFEDYQEKIDCLLKNGIGLWDSLQSCLREGSLDSNIKDEVPNNFKQLLQDNPKIALLLFNGQKAYKFFKRHHEEILEKINYVILPSTSPANASIPFQTKFEEWKKALLAEI